MPSREDLPTGSTPCCTSSIWCSTKGYSASAGDSLTRPDLSGEAIRLGRLLVELLPEPEAIGLLALMLLHDARRAARTSPDGELILLDAQDRSLWNRAQIAEGVALVERALSSRRAGPVLAAGRDRRGPCRSARRRDDRLAADRRPLRRAHCASIRRRSSSSIARRRSRCATVPPPASRSSTRFSTRGDLADYHLAHLRESGSLPASRTDRRCDRRLRTRARADDAAARAAIHRATAGGVTAGLKACATTGVASGFSRTCYHPALQFRLHPVRGKGLSHLRSIAPPRTSFSRP